jgi:segregation and condensation protein B
MTAVTLKTIVEGLLFVADEPLSLARLIQALEEPPPPGRLERVLDELMDEYEEQGRAFVLRPVAGGFQFRSRPELAPYILRLKKKSPARLSTAAVHTLAIIAYCQPILKAEVEKRRGVESGGLIKSLLEKQLIRVVGRRDLPGRPLLYGTTRKFLETYELPSLDALPSIEEIESLGLAEPGLFATGRKPRTPPEKDGTEAPDDTSEDGEGENRGGAPEPGPEEPEEGEE